MRKGLLHRFMILGAFVFLYTSINAQVRPYINSISPVSANVGETVTIVGSGFPTNDADLVVTFGGVQATFNTATNTATLIEVTVPAAATYDEIMVTNSSTGLSGTSSDFFMLSFGGDSFTGLTLTEFRNAFADVVDLDISTTSGRTQRFPYDLCTCDFDGDGKQDVVVTAQENGSVRAKRVVFKNNSTISNLSLTPVLELRNQPSRNVNCKDLNGDGKPDLVISEINGPDDTGTIDIEVYLNTSTGTSISFSSPQFLALPRDQNNDIRTPARIEIEDIDLDGKNDIISSTINDNALDIYLNNSTTSALSFENSDVSVTLPEEDVVRAFKVADVNQDGLKDLILTVNEGGEVYVYENESTSGSIQFGEPILAPVSGQVIIQNVEIADVNGDGKYDIIVTDGNASQSAGDIFIFENTTQDIGDIPSFSSGISFDTDAAPWGLNVADIDGDGDVDIANAVSSITEGVINVLVNESTSSNISFTTRSLESNANSRNLKLTDINGDAKPDILYTSNSRTLTDGSLSVIINQNCITPAISPENEAYCPGNSFILTATAASETTFIWQVSTNNGATWSNRQTSTSNTYDAGLDGLNTTSIQVRVQATSNDGNCSRTSDPVALSLNNNTPPNFNITAPSSVCEGATLNLSTTTSVANYFWSGPNDFTSTAQNPSIADIAAAGAGTYELVIQASNGCKSTPQSAQVNVIATPIPNFTNTGDDAFCDGSQVVLEATSFSGFNRQWNLDGSPVTGQTGTRLTASASGDYSLTLISTANTSCTSTSDALTLTEVPPPSPTINAAGEICVGVEYEWGSTVTGSDEFGYNYSWNLTNGGNSVTTGDADTLAFTFNNASTYNASLTVGYDDVANCTNTVNQDIIASTPPTIEISAATTEKCPADSILVELPTGQLSYEWSNGATTNSTYATTAAGENSATLDVTILTTIQCSVNASITINNYANGGITITTPNPDLSIVDQLLEIPSGITSIELQANGGTNYSWEPFEIFDDPNANLVTVRPRRVETDVILSGTDANSCAATDSLRLLNDNVEARKSFSPNGDGLGFECWEILNTANLEGCTLYVLDRRGRTIFQADTPFVDDCAWNGIDVDGKQAPEGVYYYVFKCDDSALDRTGNFLLGR